MGTRATTRLHNGSIWKARVSRLPSSPRGSHGLRTPVLSTQDFFTAQSLSYHSATATPAANRIHNLLPGFFSNTGEASLYRRPACSSEHLTIVWHSHAPLCADGMAQEGGRMLKIDRGGEVMSDGEGV